VNGALWDKHLSMILPQALEFLQFKVRILCTKVKRQYRTFRGGKTKIHFMYFRSLLCLKYSFYDCFILCMFCFFFCVFGVFVLFCVLFLLMYVVVSFLFIYSVRTTATG
jgi:hypothetical protein